MTAVYIAQAPSGAVKIGYSDDPVRRVAELRFRGERPRLVHATGQLARFDAIWLEDNLLERFEHLRIDGEWHRPGLDLLVYVESLGASLWTPGPVEGDMA